jgi:hypothetical protein
LLDRGEEQVERRVRIGDRESRLMAMATVEDYLVAKAYALGTAARLEDTWGRLGKVADPDGAGLEGAFEQLRGQLRAQILRFAPDLDEEWLKDRVRGLDELLRVAAELGKLVWAGVPEWVKKNSAARGGSAIAGLIESGTGRVTGNGTAGDGI